MANEKPSILDIVINAVSEEKRKGTDALHVDNLLNYLTALKQELQKTENSAKNINDIEVKKWELEHQGLLARYGRETEQQLEMFRSVIVSGQAALKSLMLINGGACVALLAFLGHLYGIEGKELIILDVTRALLFFAVGVLLGGVASATTYFSQALYSENSRKAGSVCQAITIIIGVGSLVMFGLGIYEAYKAFS